MYVIFRTHIRFQYMKSAVSCGREIFLRINDSSENNIREREIGGSFSGFPAQCSCPE